jgi:hypothetical protein
LAQLRGAGFTWGAAVVEWGPAAAANHFTDVTD